MDELYLYKAHVVRVVDGDTVEVDLDLGFQTVLHKQMIRLHGIDAPEVRGPERPEGLVSSAWLKERVEGKDIILKTIKDRQGKFGRWLGVLVRLIDEPRTEETINDEMVKLGLAEYVDYD